MISPNDEAFQSEELLAQLQALQTSQKRLAWALGILAFLFVCYALYTHLVWARRIVAPAQEKTSTDTPDIPSGRIDYTFTMTKEGTFQTAEDMQRQIDYTMGSLDEAALDTYSQVSSSKSATGAITVKGGSPSARAVLENDISVYDLFKELAKTTTGSHVTIYNNDLYGSVYKETMKEFFPE